jgi:hypothetical protein
MATGDENFICDTCRKIDFKDLLWNPRKAKIWYEQPRWAEKNEPSPHTMRYSKDCELCALLFQRVPARKQEETLELRSFSLKTVCRWTQESNLDADHSVIMKIGLQFLQGFIDYSPDYVFCKLASNVSQCLYCVQPVQEAWDFAKARSWLDTCVTCHESTCKQEFIEIPGMNLIDCKDMVIVKAAEGLQWLALSYVWGVSHQVSTSTEHTGFREGSLIPSNLPGTVRDAISVTMQLGYRYLWVDEYCIDQSNDEHRNAQIKSMDQIYCGADLTIVAAAGEDKTYGLPGVEPTKRKGSKVVCMEDVVIFSNGPEPDSQAKQSKWFTRAW